MATIKIIGALVVNKDQSKFFRNYYGITHTVTHKYKFLFQNGKVYLKKSTTLF